MTEWKIGCEGDLIAVMGLPFSDEQLAAVTAPLGPGLILAGAGTGKTTVMAARVVWLVGTGLIEPGAVLGLTFTRRAARELDLRITAALAHLNDDADDDRPLVMTYDAFVGQLLAGQGLRLGADATGRLMTGAEPYQLADQAVADPSFAPLALQDKTPFALVDALLRLDRQMAGHMVTADDLHDWTNRFLTGCDVAPGYRGAPYKSVTNAAGVAAQRAELLGFVQRYRDLKRLAGVVEFADQQAVATRLATTIPAVGAALRQQFQLVLLDEYQDTSAAQAAMLAGLFSGSDPARGRGHPVSAVGDPMQAIYGWRGAASDNMGRFGGLFPLADAGAPPVFPLTVNRRSGSVIVTLANEISAGDGDVRDATTALKPAPSRGSGHIEASTYTTWPQEVAALASRIVEAHRLGQAPHWSDVAVLLRRNADIPPVYRALTGLGVPVEIVGLGGLLALPEIAAIVSILRLVEDDGDNPAVTLLVSGPSCGLGPRDMAALARRARELAESDVSGAGPLLLDAVFDPGVAVGAEARRRLRRLAARIRAVRHRRFEPAVDLVRIAADVLGLTAELEVSSAWSQAIAPQFNRFVAHVADHAGRTGHVSLAGLLQWLDDEATHGEQLDQATPSEDDSVKLLTVHKAKGLEWSVVALPALDKGVFPNDRVDGNPLTNPAELPFGLRLDADSVPKLTQIDNDGFKVFTKALKADQAASEDRLAYVAVTRAKEWLLASSSQWRAGAVSPRPPSRLFDAIIAQAEASGGAVSLAPPPGQDNPLADITNVVAWPATLGPDEQARLDAAAAAVTSPTPPDGTSSTGLSAEDAQRVVDWQASVTRLIAQRASDDRPSRMPASVSASSLMLARRDPAAFSAEVARPMPHLTGAPANRGSAFHRWVERRFAVVGALDDLGDPADPGWPPATAGFDGIADLVAAFEQGLYANREPIAVETPFIAIVAGQQVRGRIDAVYEQTGSCRFQVVDWKTSRSMTADPVQLSLYRLAWAQSAGCPLQEVDAVFYYVGQNEVVRPEPASMAQIEAWVRALRLGDSVPSAERDRP